MLVFEEILAGMLILVVITQVFIPVSMNKKIFWLFRPSTYADRRLKKAQQEEEEARRLKEAAELSARALRLKVQARATEARALGEFLEVEEPGEQEPTTGEEKPQKETVS